MDNFIPDILTDGELAKLSWEILEHKVLYYYWCDPFLEDTEYDFLEKMYEQASGKKTDVGFPFNRPSAQIVLGKSVQQIKEGLEKTWGVRKNQIDKWKQKYYNKDIS